MKQSALLAAMTLIVAATPLTAGDPYPYPPPTGMAPTTPQVPVPVLQEGAVTSVDAGRSRWLDRFGGTGRDCSKPGLLSRICGVSLFGGSSSSDCEPYDPCRVKPQWCADCAPAVRRPLPPLPPGILTGACRERAAPQPACERGSCWNRFAEWLCFRQTPVHLPCTPTPRYAPLYTYLPCREHGGAIGGGCDISRTGLGHRGRVGAGDCTPCPAPGQAIMPGYRLAVPESSADPMIATSHYRPPTR